MRTKQAVSLFGLMVLVVVVALTPWVDGYFLKQHYINLLAAVSEENKVSIQVLDYNQGWFSSHAKIYVTSTDDKNKTEGSTIEQDISHGPYAYDGLQNGRVFALGVIHTGIVFPKELKTFLVNKAGQDDLQVNTVIGFNNVYESQILTPTFQYVFPGGNVTWQGLQGSVISHVTNDRIDQVKVNLTIGAVKGLMGDQTVNVQDITLQTDTSKHPIGLWVGTTGLKVPAVIYNEGISPKFNLMGLVLSLTTMINAQNNYDFEKQISLSSLITPYFKINASSINIKGNDFNAKTFVDLMNAVKTQKGGVMSDYVSANLPRILTPTTKISEDIRIDTSVGKFTSTGTVSWPVNAASSPLDKLLDSTNFKVTVRISAALVDKIIEVMNQDDSSPADKTAASAQEATEAGLLAQIDLWSSENKISSYTASQLKDLVKLHLDGDVFAENVEPYVQRKDVPMEIADSLKARYSLLYPAKKAAIPGAASTVTNVAAEVATPVPAPAAPTITPAQKAKDLFNHWVEQKLITQDKDEYVTVITREQGMIKFNNIPAPVNDLMSH